MKSKTFLPFHRPSIGNNEIRRVNRVLKSGWLTRGQVTEDFEKRVKEYVGTRHCVAMNSCTSALHLSLLSASIGSADEVIVPTFTFAASGNVVVHTGARPVLADIDEETFNISISSLEQSITERTRAIIGVDYAGHPCEIDQISKVARPAGIMVVQDAAHSFGARFRGNKIGKQADTTCFSFYVTKNITTAEGGALVTQSNRISEKARILSLHGMSKDAWKRYGKGGSWYYEVVDFGFKYNMNDVQAAIGIAQLDKVESLHKKRQQIASLYSEALIKLDGVKIPQAKKHVKHAWHLYPIRIERKAEITRDKVIDLLTKHGIGTSVHFIPLHLHPAYQRRFNYRRGDFPIAERVFDEIVSLPLYPTMTISDVSRVIHSLSDILKKR